MVYNVTGRRRRFARKTILISPEDTDLFLSALDARMPSTNGDRTCPYMEIAEVSGRCGAVYAALVEEKSGLPENEWGYAIHVLNDIEPTDDEYVLRTPNLDSGQLSALLAKVLFALANGRM